MLQMTKIVVVWPQHSEFVASAKRMSDYFVLHFISEAFKYLKRPSSYGALLTYLLSWQVL